MSKSRLPTGLLAVVLLAAASWAVPGRAADLYLSAGLATSWGGGDTAVSLEDAGVTLFAKNASDTDTSPVFSGVFGIEVPMEQFLPLDWDTSLPTWPLRFELEGLGGRDYELVTPSGSPATFLSRVESWSLLHNMWLDMPVHAPLSWAFGRLPLLEPMTFYLGGGVGVAHTDVSSSDNDLKGGDSGFGFTWQVGAGFGYRLTDRVTVGLGYRYVSLGSFDYALQLNPATPDTFGRFKVDLAAHELNSGLRVNFYAVPSPGEWASRRGR